MSSLKSVRQVLDSKSTRSTRSTKSTQSNGSNRSTLLEIKPSFTDAMKVQSALHNKKVNMKELLAGRSAKRQASFDNARAALPVGAHISYVLHRLFKDRKTGELKNVYCNSAFYRGTIDIKSRDIVTQREIVTPVLIVVSGKTTYQLAEDEIKELYVYENQADFAKTPKERSNEQKKRERERSKSLDHGQKRPESSKTALGTPKVVSGIPKTVSDKSKTMDRSSLLNSRRKVKSLAH